MAVFQPSYLDKDGERVKSAVWWVKFAYRGKLIRESAKTTRKTIAVEYERKRKLELERQHAGLQPHEPSSTKRLQSVLDVTNAYRKTYAHGHRPKSIAWVSERLQHVDRLLGKSLLPLSEERVREYMATRKAEDAGPRTVNMEVSILARAIGHPWNLLWPKLKHFEEPHDT